MRVSIEKERFMKKSIVILSLLGCVSFAFAALVPDFEGGGFSGGIVISVSPDGSILSIDDLTGSCEPGAEIVYPLQIPASPAFPDSGWVYPGYPADLSNLFEILFGSQQVVQIPPPDSNEATAPSESVVLYYVPEPLTLGILAFGGLLVRRQK